MKYMGSKSRIKKYVVPILQELIDKNNIKVYIEPMVGGCNIIDSIKCEHKIGNDISTPLIEMWKHLKETNGDDIPLEVSREHYNDVKKNQNTNKYPLWYIGIIGFLASYNGKYFDGGYAKTVITKTGIKRNYYDESRRNIIKQISNLKDVIFTNNDYKYMKEIKNALIYADIPYKNTTQYQSCNNFDYGYFWNWVREQSKNNIVIVSELQAPDDFMCIWEQEVTRTQNNKSRAKSIEKLFVYKDNYKKYFDIAVNRMED